MERAHKPSGAPWITLLPAHSTPSGSPTRWAVTTTRCARADSWRTIYAPGRAPTPASGPRASPHAWARRCSRRRSHAPRTGPTPRTRARPITTPRCCAAAVGPGTACAGSARTRRAPTTRACAPTCSRSRDARSPSCATSIARTRCSTRRCAWRPTPPGRWSSCRLRSSWRIASTRRCRPASERSRSRRRCGPRWSARRTC